MTESGTLYIVATPIGNLDDISARAIAVLASVSKIAAEDTRHSKRLMQAINVVTPLIPYHDFSSESASQKILAELQAGEDIALISDAGTPLISDPGYRLVTEAREAGLSVIPIPGASALTAALSVSGLPTDRFIFEGFLPAKTSARQARLKLFLEEDRTVVIYESPHRISACLQDMREVLGTERLVFIAREISKKFETHFLGSIERCVAWLESDSNQQKGEFVVIIGGCPETVVSERQFSQAVELVRLLEGEVSMKRAVAIASEFTGARKNKLYNAVLNN